MTALVVVVVGMLACMDEAVVVTLLTAFKCAPGSMEIMLVAWLRGVGPDTVLAMLRCLGCMEGPVLAVVLAGLMCPCMRDAMLPAAAPDRCAATALTVL